VLSSVTTADTNDGSGAKGLARRERRGERVACEERVEAVCRPLAHAHAGGGGAYRRARGARATTSDAASRRVLGGSASGDGHGYFMILDIHPAIFTYKIRS
jgi:hypothetical protein